MAQTVLPRDFKELERFAEWILPTEQERHHKRLGCSMEEIRSFYEAMMPRMDDVMRQLDRFSFDAPAPAEVTNLYLLALSFMEVSHPIELRWGATNNQGAFSSTRIEIPYRR